MQLEVILACGVLALLYGLYTIRSVLSLPAGTERMQEIAAAIQEGARAYLNRQYTTIAMVGVVIFALAFFFLGWQVALGFLIGATLSGAAGYVGMYVSVRANVRTAEASRSGLAAGLSVAFRAGAVTGMLVVGFGLLGVAGYYAFLTKGLGLDLASTAQSRIIVDSLVGLGFGASLISIFARLGGGIFTKGADVGGDMVGKVEAGIPEDDPRNPATIADNVGDNVGDCAGMAADLFETYEVTLVASIILGVTAFNSIGMNPALGLVFPLAARAIGVVASIVGIFFVRAKPGETNALKPINRGFLVAGTLTLVGTLLVALLYVGNDQANAGWKCFGAVAVGLILAQLVSRLTEYFTGTHFGPVKEIAESAETGPATVVLSGTSSGLESSVYAIICIALAIACALGLGGGNLQFSLYLVALCGMGMLATTGVVVSEDTFGPVADNAAGIAEMSGEFHGEPERIMVSLDAVGNTTKAVTKGFAIGSAVIAAVALFSSYIETIGSELNLGKEGSALFSDPLTQINVSNP